MVAMTLKLLAQCLEENVKENIATFIWGPPGVGKSDAVRQVAKKMGYGLVDIRLSLRDPVDLRGLPLVDAKTGTTRWLPPAELPEVKRDGMRGFLFLDEANVASKAMQGAAMSLVLDRKLGEYKLPDGWVPIAAGNRMIDRAIAERMGTALKNRYAHFEVAVDLESWCAWATANGIDPMTIAFIRWRPNLLHMMPGSEAEGITIPEDANSFPTCRGWEKVARVAQKDPAIRQHLVTALVGAGPAAEFEGFARIWASLPSVKQILTSPLTARVPPMSEPSTFYALSAKLAREATKANFGNIVTYAARMPKAFEVFTVVDAVHRDPSLTQTPAFSKWAVGNQEVVI